MSFCLKFTAWWSRDLRYAFSYCSRQILLKPCWASRHSSSLAFSLQDQRGSAQAQHGESPGHPPESALHRTSLSTYTSHHIPNLGQPAPSLSVHWVQCWRRREGGTVAPGNQHFPGTNLLPALPPTTPCVAVGLPVPHEGRDRVSLTQLCNPRANPSTQLRAAT